MEQDAPDGDATSGDPHNLIVGGGSAQTINGTYRSDTILGRGGDDIIDDGDAPGDAIWANDTLIGGADNDTFKAGAGNDTIWGGDKDDDEIGGGGTDTADYNALTSGITIHFDGTGAAPTITVSGATAGTDTLHSIEVITATDYSDRFEYIGTIPAGYSLTVDLAGDVDTYVDLGGAESALVFNSGVITQSGGDGGTITLLNVHTMISGTMYDDEITDEAEGDKHIYGGEGDDEITVDNGDAVIRGGLGDDEINGGDGNDILRGEWGADIVHGGEGSDLVANFRIDLETLPGVIIEDADELYGDEGADYLLAMALSWGATLDGGTGNDVIDAREARQVTVRFGAGDGHDMILSDRELGVEYDEDPRDGVERIDMTTVSKSQVTIIWDPQIVIEHILPNGNPQDTPGSITRQGDLVIRIDGTGDTIHIKNVTGTTTYWNDPSESTQPPFDHIFDWVSLGGVGLVEFADGFLEAGDFLGANPVLALQFGSVAQYATALDEYLDAIAADPGENEGTSGDDDMRGSRGDDAINGGEGADSFHGSGGRDAIDGGAGIDRLILFGARADFRITRDSESGDVTLEDKTGLEGQVTIKSVEKIYFATDNEEFAPGDLVGFWGTPGDDALVEGNERDNLIYGLAGSDLLRGLAGNDFLDGGTGADTMQGGTGNDVYIVDEAGDVVTEAYNSGSDEVRTALASYTLGANVERLTGLLATGQTLTGNSLANILTGGAGADVLNGGSGSDTAAWAGRRPASRSISRTAFSPATPPATR